MPYQYCVTAVLSDMVKFRGNGDLTYDEAKSHFTAWAFMKSPLLIVRVSPLTLIRLYLSSRTVNRCKLALPHL
jgi:hypothetical protein